MTQRDVAQIAFEVLREVTGPTREIAATRHHLPTSGANSARVSGPRASLSREQYFELGRRAAADRATGRLSADEKVAVLNCVSKGMALQATVRETGINIQTVRKLVFDLGRSCAQYQNRVLQDLHIDAVQCKEVRSFGAGDDASQDIALPAHDIYAFCAIDPITGLVPCWVVGAGNLVTAREFVMDLLPRFSRRSEIIADDCAVCLDAVHEVFGLNGSQRPGAQPNETQQSNLMNLGRRVDVQAARWETGGDASPPTTTRLWLRMDAPSVPQPRTVLASKLERFMRAVSVQFMVYNFVTTRNDRKETPAMAAGVSNRPWSPGDILSIAAGKR